MYISTQWLIFTHFNKRKKFDFAHQTISCPEVPLGWTDYVNPTVNQLSMTQYTSTATAVSINTSKNVCNGQQKLNEYTMHIPTDSDNMFQRFCITFHETTQMLQNVIYIASNSNNREIN